MGEHVAKAYAELGANVVISARSQDRLDRIAAEINALDGGRALAVAADAGEKADLENLVAKAREAFELHREDEKVREKYGMNRFGQSCLLAASTNKADD